MIIFENEPSDPDEIILKNEFYPNGLTHASIYNYYLFNKSKILQEVKGRELIFFFLSNLNKIVVKRRTPLGYYKLTSSNYDSVLSGRTISIHSTMNNTEKFGIVDIDGYDWSQNKIAAFKIYSWLNELSFKNISLIYTGKTSFHIRVNFDKIYTIDDIKKHLEFSLKVSKKFNYPISYKRLNNTPNIDLSSNKLRGGFITLYSLSILGLKCMQIDPKFIMKFEKIDARIKV